MAKVLGHWKLEKSDEYWDEYMKAVGVNFALRQIGKRISAREEIAQDGDTWSLDIFSTFKDIHLKFKLGEEFDEVTADGRKVKSTFKDEDGKLVHYQNATEPGAVSSVVTRDTVDDNTMHITMVALGKDVTTVRTFKRETS